LSEASGTPASTAQSPYDAMGADQYPLAMLLQPTKTVFPAHEQAGSTNAGQAPQ